MVKERQVSFRATQQELDEIDVRAKREDYDHRSEYIIAKLHDIWVLEDGVVDVLPKDQRDDLFINLIDSYLRIGVLPENIHQVIDARIRAYEESIQLLEEPKED